MPHICSSVKAFNRLSEYAETYGVSVEYVLEKAVNFFWNEVGEFSIEDARRKGLVKKRRSRRKPVMMPCTVVVPVKPEKIAVNQ